MYTTVSLSVFVSLSFSSVLSLSSMQAVRLSCWTLMRDSVYYTISVTALIVVSSTLSGFSCSYDAYGPPRAAGEEKQVALPWGLWPAAQASYLPTLCMCSQHRGTTNTDY